MAFPFLGLFIIFLSVAAYYRKRATAQQKKVTEDFWSREDQANQIRRKDISNLPYITIPLEKFPIGISDDEELTDYENDLKTLASRKILNLSHQSNTDLKLAYGPANLPALSEYDQNYTTLLRNLVAYADCLIKNGFEAEAVPVLDNSNTERPSTQSSGLSASTRTAPPPVHPQSRSSTRLSRRPQR